MTHISVPTGAKHILQKLHAAGYSAYVVGGCVRDSLLGRTAHDWDITTSAKPLDMMRIFSEETIYETGIKHGTLTIRSCDHELYEVTTYRTDGNYSDNRHPDEVIFVTSLKQDILRRDFTMNALAYNEKEGIVDYVSGYTDISRGIIRCVGNADERFNEDALRILRALRFSATYGFKIDEATDRAIHRNKHLLNNIAKERVHDELVKMLLGNNILDVLLSYSDVISFIIPELGRCIGFEQNNPYHCYNVYDHIAYAVDAYKGTNPKVLLALLLHDIGKPLCYTEDERGGHFHGHAEISADMAERILTNLKFDNDTKHTVVELIRAHDMDIAPTKKSVRRALSKFGPDFMALLMDVRLADIMAHSSYLHDARIEKHTKRLEILDTILAENQCFSLKDLAVNGNDIMETFGLKPGKHVGEILHHLLDLVIADEIPNDKTELLIAAKRFL